MSNLNKAQRDALPAQDFGDPGRRLYPIVDQDDVDSAARLIGKAADPEKVKARIIAIAKRKGLSIPDAWKEDAKMSATFALGDPTPAGDIVRRSGKVFEAGEYRDKGGFAITPEEMLAAIADFKPVPVDLEHRPSVLGGKLGTLESVELGPDGWSLMGTVALPKWLDDALADTPRAVSTAWDIASKQLIGLALVTEPRVSDAALMSAYAAFAAARHDTPHGQNTLQVLHDIASENGATCKAGNAKMASSHEAAAMQAVHDVTTQHGASCAGINPNTDRAPNVTVNPNVGPSPRVMYSGSEPKRRKPMSFKDTVMAWFGKGMPDEFDPTADMPPTGVHLNAADAFNNPPVLNGTVTAGFNAPRPLPQIDPEYARMKKKVEELEAARIVDKATAWADTEIAAFRALPAERDSLIAAYTQAAADDENHGVVTFADGTQKGRVDQLKAMLSARVPHALTKEQLTPQNVAALLNKQETRPDPNKELSPEEVAKLINVTPLGSALMSRGNGNGH